MLFFFSRFQQSQPIYVKYYFGCAFLYVRLTALYLQSLASDSILFIALLLDAFGTQSIYIKIVARTQNTLHHFVCRAAERFWCANFFFLLHPIRFLHDFSCVFVVCCSCFFLCALLTFAHTRNCYTGHVNRVQMFNSIMKVIRAVLMFIRRA